MYRNNYMKIYSPNIKANLSLTSDIDKTSINFIPTDHAAESLIASADSTDFYSTQRVSTPKFREMSNDQKQKIAESLYNFCLEIEEKFNVQVFICGGTFLGALRDKDFIDHDDDIDIQYYIGESNIDEVHNMTKKMCKYFKHKNRLKHWFKRSHRRLKAPSHYHAWFENKIYYADVFPSWLENNDLKLGGPLNRIYCGIDANEVLPLKQINFRGLVFNAPKNPEKFAEWQWGKNWTIPKIQRHGYWPAGHKINN